MQSLRCVILGQIIGHKAQNNNDYYVRLTEGALKFQKMQTITKYLQLYNKELVG